MRGESGWADEWISSSCRRYDDDAKRRRRVGRGYSASDDAVIWRQCAVIVSIVRWL